MNDEERARLLMEGMKSSLKFSPEAEESLRSGLAEAMGKARAGQLSEDDVRRLLADIQQNKASKSATKAVRCYSVEHGDFWRGQCPDCTWTSRNLPFPTREQAEHATDLHKALCKGSRQ